MREYIYSEVKHIGLFQKRYFLLRLSDLFNTLVILSFKKKDTSYLLDGIYKADIYADEITQAGQKNREVSSKCGTNFLFFF